MDSTAKVGENPKVLGESCKGLESPVKIWETPVWGEYFEG